MRRTPLLATLVAVLALAAACGLVGPDREVVTTDAAPRPIAPYSQAIRVGDTLYLSGQIGIDPASGQLLEGTYSQTRQALQNCKAIVEEAGFTLADVVQVLVYLDDIADYDTFNTVYAPYFPEGPPARAVVEAADLPRDAKVEIVMTAVRSR